MNCSALSWLTRRETSLTNASRTHLIAITARRTARSELWVPAIMEEHFKRATSVDFRMVGRLAPGISRGQAVAAVDLVTARVAAKYGGKPLPGYQNEGIFRSDLRSELRHAALGLWGA